MKLDYRWIQIGLHPSLLVALLWFIHDQNLFSRVRFVLLFSAHRSSSFWFCFTDPVLSQILLPLLLPLSNQERKEWKNNRTIGCDATCKTTKSSTGKETLFTRVDVSKKFSSLACPHGCFFVSFLQCFHSVSRVRYL